MRIVAIAFAVCLLLLASSAHAEPGLAIGLEMQGDSVRQVSVSSIEHVVPPRSGDAARWTLRATARDGSLLWNRAVGAPTQHHGDPARPLQFVLTLPRPAPGTRLTLLDALDRTRWQTRVSHRLIEQADATRQRLDEDARRAREAAKAAPDEPASPALLRQIRAGQERADSIAMRRNTQPHAAATAPAASPLQERGGPSLDAPPAATRATLTPILPFSFDPAASPAPLPGPKTSVPARIVLEDGSVPGVEFTAWLNRASGEFLQQIAVPSDGRITLELNGSGDYRLFLEAPPPFLQETFEFSYNGSTPANFVLKRGWRIDLDVLDAGSGTRIVDEFMVAWVRRNNSAMTVSGTTTNGRIALAVPRDPAASYTLTLTSTRNHPGIIQPLAPISGNFATTVSLPRAERVVVETRDSDGNLLTPVYVQCDSVEVVDGREYLVSGITDTAGRLELPMPRGLHYDCYVTGDQALQTQWFFDVPVPATGPLNFTLHRHSALRLLLQDESGQPFTGAFRADWYDVDIGVSGSCTANPCELRVPSHREITIWFQFEDEQWRDFSLGPERFAEATERTLTVQRVHRLEGSVLDAAGAVDEAHVLVYDEHGAFVDSIHTGNGGRFAFPLASGRYRVHAFAPSQVFGIATSDDWLFRAATVSDLVTLSGDVQLPDLRLAESHGQLALHARLPCQPIGADTSASHSTVLHLTTASGTHVQQTWSPDAASVSTPDANGECLSTYIARLSPGTYSLSATALGWPEKALGAVTIAANQRRDIAVAFPLAERSRLWQPTLRYADGSTAALAIVTVYDEAQRWLYATHTDASGRTAVPWNPGWGAELYLPATAAKTALRRSLTFAGTPPPDVLQFDTATLTASADADILRLFGNGDRQRRYNILFVAEGYTAERETFTDTNGNGVWDGVLWHDLNQDAVFNSGDWAALYGNATWPAEGSVPDAGNEPFVDRNGDGALSLDDRALFIENAHSFMRSLLGSDYWSEHRDAFNAYAYFSPSPQAGYDIVDADGTTVLLERDTLYDAGVELDRHLLLLDRDAALQRGLNVLPEVDIVVTLINQPVPAGRANVSFGGSGPGAMIYYGGMQQTSPNGIVQSHEMGHFVGALCDEYSEFPGQHPNRGSADAGCANISYRHQREHLPWKTFVAAGTALPTLDSDGVIGAYIGGSYYRNGAFRPSEHSTMRNNSPFFNAPSRAALASATCTRTTGNAACEPAGAPLLHTATWWDPSESGWGLFTIDQGNVIAPGWFTYDLDGEPTWFLVPGALPQADGSYRGDILRYTGVPFPQIAANGANPPTPVGSATLRFDGDDSLQFAYTIDGDTTTRTLSRFVYGDRDIVCRASTTPPEQATHYSDLWWSPASAGWGLLLAHVGDTLYATWYTYDLDGEAVFMVGAATRQADGSYRGGLVRQRDGTPYPQIDGAPPSPGVDAVGTLELRFDDGNHGSFAWQVGASSGQHAITRLQFGSTVAACEAVPVTAD